MNYARKKILADTFFLFLIWIPCTKVEQPQGMELQKKQEEKRKKHISKMIRKSLKRTGT